MEIKPEVLDELLKGIKTQEDLAGPNGLLKAITKALVERMLEGEMTHHLGYEKSDPAGSGSGNSRNGKTRKTLRSEQGEIEVAVPRDREGSFEPQLVRKHQTRWNGLDEKIISLYARGMTVRDIQAQLHELYGVEVSPGLYFGSDRRGVGGSEGLAEPAVGEHVPGVVSGCVDGKNAP